MYEHRDRQINEVANKENLSSRQHNKRIKLSNIIYRQTHRQTDRQTDRLTRYQIKQIHFHDAAGRSWVKCLFLLSFLTTSKQFFKPKKSIFHFYQNLQKVVALIFFK
jgi:hypothetical protein